MKPVETTVGAATACGNSGASRAKTAPMRLPGNAAICSQRFATIGRMRVGDEAPAGIGVVVHLGDIDRGAAARGVERAAKNQRAAGIALDQQDDLPVAQQRREAAGDAFLKGAAGAHRDDIGAVDRGGEDRS